MIFHRRFRLLAPLALTILAGCAGMQPKPLPSPSSVAPTRPDMAPIPNPPPAPHPHPAAPIETTPPPAQPADPLRAAQLRGEGLEQLNRGALAKAVVLLKQANALDPGNPLIKHDLERALHALHDRKARR
jgi:hypothetical protein